MVSSAALAAQRISAAPLGASPLVPTGAETASVDYCLAVMRRCVVPGVLSRCDKHAARSLFSHRSFAVFYPPAHRQCLPGRPDSHAYNAGHAAPVCA